MDPGECPVQYPAFAIERNACHQIAIRPHDLSREFFKKRVIQRLHRTIDEYEYVLRHFVKGSTREQLVNPRSPAIDISNQRRMRGRVFVTKHVTKTSRPHLFNRQPYTCLHLLSLRHWSHDDHAPKRKNL
jgi:hypothetical protein